MILTGFALYAEGPVHGSWADQVFGWAVLSVGGNSTLLHTCHHFGMWWIVILMIVHICEAIREDIMSRRSILSPMIIGTRTFKDDNPDWDRAL